MGADVPPPIRARVAIYQTRMVHYRIPLFERMRALARERGIHVDVLYGEPSPRERHRRDSADLRWGIRTRNRYFDVGRIELVWQPSPPVDPAPDLVVVTQENRLIHNYVHMVRRIFGGPRVAFWGHGRNFQSVTRRGPSHWWKSMLTPHVDWWFAYTELSRAHMIASGADPARTTSLENTIDTAAFRDDLARVTPDDLARLRERLGLDAHAEVALYCGSLTEDKLLDLLVEGCRRAQAAHPRLALVVVGDGPRSDWIKAQASLLPWMRVLPATYGPEKAALFRLASLIANPGMVGLSIVDAMVAGLPMVTTHAGRHSPEISYLENGINGFITAGTAEAFSDMLLKLLRSPETRKRIGEAALERSRDLTIENMARRFVAGLATCLGFPAGPNDDANPAPGPPAPGGSAAAETPRKRPLRVAFLTNMVPPYRIGTLRALAARVEALRVLVSVGMEANRDWEPEWFDLDVRVQRNFTLRRLERHPSGYVQEVFLHIPFDSVTQLRAFRPDTVVSVEFGPRTALAIAYKKLHPAVRLVIYADLSERTELGRAGARTKLRSWMLRQADAVIVNGASGDRYVQSLGVPQDRIFRVPYATDLAFELGRSSPGPEGGPLRLIHVGQLIDRKGLAPFVVLLAEWCRAHPERKVTLALAGDGPQRSAIASVAVPPSLEIDLMGQVPYESLPELYRTADILVLPTLADTWGLVVNEAMAAGLPVLGSVHSQAVQEMVVDGENGWRFDPEDRAQALSVLDRALATDTADIVRMGARARETATRIDASAVAERMLAAVDGRAAARS